MSEQTAPKKVVVVMPAYFAEKTLRRTYEEIPKDWVDHVILVDDASTDRTVEIARELGIEVHVHPKNRGYGGNQKTCYRLALERGADVVVMLHPDHQYNPRLIPDLLRPLVEERCDAVFGSRMLGGRFLEGGMPIWKFFGNVVLTAIANLTLCVYLTEIHSGYRAYTRRYLETVRLEEDSDDFVFDTEIIVQGIAAGMRFFEVPIETRYFEEASSINFARSVVYGLSILGVLLRYRLHAWGVLRDRRLLPR